MSKPKPMNKRDATLLAVDLLRRRGFLALDRVGKSTSRYVRTPGRGFKIRVSDHPKSGPQDPDVLAYVRIRPGMLYGDVLREVDRAEDAFDRNMERRLLSLYPSDVSGYQGTVDGDGVVPVGVL